MTERLEEDNRILELALKGTRSAGVGRGNPSHPRAASRELLAAPAVERESGFKGYLGFVRVRQLAMANTFCVALGEYELGVESGVFPRSWRNQPVLAHLQLVRSVLLEAVAFDELKALAFIRFKSLAVDRSTGAASIGKGAPDTAGSLESQTSRHVLYKYRFPRA
jgi:hypothetical protein